MEKCIAIIGTLDTKGREFKFIKDAIEGNGLQTLVIDTGVMGGAAFTADIASEEVALAGGKSLEALREARDRGMAMDVMMTGARKVLEDLYEAGAIHGVIGMGGSAGTTIGSYAMQGMPVGFPKMMVSTVASGDTSPYVDVKDITMMYSVVDISGVNSLSKVILSNAADGISGMVLLAKAMEIEEKPLIGATMFGVTTPAVTAAREYLESKGYEVLVFHATGSGGRAMESLIEAGYIKGVLDVTTTEWCDELMGGVLSAGAHRLEAAARKGIPQVVSTGALDMVNFGPYQTVPEHYKSRNLYKHNATITLMRTTPEENRQLGSVIAAKLNESKGKTVLFLPLKGVSMIDVEGQPFYDPEADRVLFETLQAEIDPGIVTVEAMDTDINDPAFAIAMAKRLIDLMEVQSSEN
ncbi:MAG: hypothetical protein AVO33_05075 [delta proteobacterium ML8_F1]|nr:MAG: hypothetical protein AVO33_05075 [delta proteobacterium ML8_F1]